MTNKRSLTGVFMLLVLATLAGCSGGSGGAGGDTPPVAPGFTTQPANATITEGQNAQFTVAVSGTPTPTLQWQSSHDNGGAWSNILGATSDVYTAVGETLANDGRQFRAVASNSAGSVNSNAAVLTVNPRTWGTAAVIETDNVGNAFSPQSPSTPAAMPWRCGTSTTAPATTSGPTATPPESAGARPR